MKEIQQPQKAICCKNAVELPFERQDYACNEFIMKGFKITAKLYKYFEV